MATAEKEQPEFGIQRLYIKDLSFEAPNSPQVFAEQWKPDLHMDLNVANTKLDDGVYEVVLTVTVTVKMEEKGIFIAETQQAGVFTLKSFPEEQVKHMLGSFCPNILYPYAREVVTDVVVKGGFPQLYLAPVNFDALLQQKEQEGATAEEAKEKA
jgi:preprotein translocase subunit SecB